MVSPSQTECKSSVNNLHMALVPIHRDGRFLLHLAFR